MSKIKLAKNFFSNFIIRKFILISTSICSNILANYVSDDNSHFSNGEIFHEKDDNVDTPCHYIFSKYVEQIGINNNIKYPQIII